MNVKTLNRFHATLALLALLVTALAGSGGFSAFAQKAESPEIAKISPKQQLVLFETVATRMQKLSAEELAGGKTPAVSGDSHPMSQVVVMNLTGDPVPADTMDFDVLVDMLLPLTWRMSAAFPDTSFDWMEKAMLLARGCYRMGLGEDAVEWLQTVDRNAGTGRLRADARRLLIQHYVMTSDSVGLDNLWESWDSDCRRGAAGRRATLAMLTSIYLREKSEDLARVARQYGRYTTHGKFYYAHNRYAAGDYATAARLVGELLWIFEKDKGGNFPPPMKLSVLMLSADIDWTTGLDGLAGQQYQLLAGVDHPFVASWSQFMLGSVAMHNKDYESAESRFNKLCQAGGLPGWQSLACTLEEHSQKMTELMKVME